MTTSLREFYQDVKGELIEEKPAASVPLKPKPGEAKPSTGGSSSSGALSGQQGRVLDLPQASSENSPAHQVIDAGKEYAQLAGSHKALVNLLDQAKAGNYEALGEIMKRYGFEPDSLQITITEPLRDAQGREPEKYGIKLIHCEEDWKAISRDWEMALAYFPDIELHNLPTTRRGKKLAVVMGVTAREFNAVIAAERRRERLENDMRALNNDMEKGRREMGVDRMPRVPAGNDKRPLASTPSQGKPASEKNMPARTTR